MGASVRSNPAAILPYHRDTRYLTMSLLTSCLAAIVLATLLGNDSIDAAEQVLFRADMRPVAPKLEVLTSVFFCCWSCGT